MKYTDIENLNPQELNKRIHQNRHLLFQTRMKHKMGRLSNFMEIADLRRLQARLQSVATIKKPQVSPAPEVKKTSVPKQPLPWKRKDFKKKLKSEKKAKSLKPVRVKKVTDKIKTSPVKIQKKTEAKPLPVSPSSQSSGFLSRWVKRLVKKDKSQ